MKKKTLFCIAGVMFLMGTIFFGHALAAEKGKVYRWRMGNTTCRGTTLFTGQTTYFTAPLKKMSKGRILIDTFADGEIIGGDRYMEAVGGGMMELCHDCPAWHPGEIEPPLFMPGDYYSEMDLQLFYEEFGGRDWINKNIYHPQGIHVFGMAAEPAQILLTKTRVSNLSEIKGMKMRSVGAMLNFLENFGAKMVHFPLSEAYTALATGVIDGGTFGNVIEDYGNGLFEPCKYIFYPAITDLATITLTINLDLWNKLPDDIKQMLKTAGRAYSASLFANQEQECKSKLREIKEKGVTVTHLPEKDVPAFRAAQRALWDQMAKKGPKAAEYISMLKGYHKAMGYMK